MREDDEPVEIESEVDEPGTVDGEGVDAWREDFPLPVNEAVYRRLDSRAWLVLPERYCYRPLAALDAAREADRLSAGVGGRGLLKLALGLRRQREAVAEFCRAELQGLAEGSEVPAEIVEQAVNERMPELVESALEEFLGEVEGRGFSPHEWALSWIQRCDLRRIPPPAVDDVGGPVATAKGPASWAEFYKGRYVVLLRLGAACAWGSLGPFFLDVRPRR